MQIVVGVVRKWIKQNGGCRVGDICVGGVHEEEGEGETKEVGGDARRVCMRVDGVGDGKRSWGWERCIGCGCG